jgi:TolB-like protein/class 3 adenylate cyclase/tetratricopeptide (TPR) repeat protein
MERRLTAILAADVVGYSTLMEKDEAGTYARLRAGRKELFEPEIHRHHGRIFKLMGDGLLAEFGSVVDAVECAVALQRGLSQRNSSLPEKERIEVRIGVNQGDVIVEGDDRYGDGVNIAARLEQIAEPGSVYVSGKVVKEVERRLALGFKPVGQQKMKNLADPVDVYRVIVDDAESFQSQPAGKRRTALRLWPAAAVLLLAVAAAGGVAYWMSGTSSPDPTAVQGSAQPAPDKSSVAVLPFSNMSDDPQQSYFADGIAEDLMTDLSHVEDLFVIARHSAFAYKGREIDVRQVGRELGVHYIVEGSVRRAGEQIRINVQLVDATTGGHEWAQRYDGSMADIFALQDRVTRSVVDALRLRLATSETGAEVPVAGLAASGTGAASQHGTEVPEAYDAFLKGWAYYQRATSADLVRAIPDFERAINLDPSYSHAQAALAMIYFRAYDEGWTGRLAITLDDAFRKAREYLNAAKKRPTSLSHQVAGSISRKRGWYEDAGKEFQAAIALEPSDPWSYAYLAYSLMHAGHFADAESQIETAMRLDPHFPALFVFYQGMAQFEQNKMQEAAATLDNAANLNPDDPMPLLYLASSYGHLGRTADGKEAIAAFSNGRVRQGGIPFVMVQLKSDFPDFKPVEGSRLIAGLAPLEISYDLDAKEFDSLRLSGKEIEALFFGHRLRGQSLQTGIEHGISVSPDGVVVRYGDWGEGAGTARLNGDRLCLTWTTTEHCDIVFRNPGGTKERENEYILYEMGWAFTFSQLE